MPFSLGANLPWVRYGCDFGANAWSPAGGLGARASTGRLRAIFDRLRAGGVELIRWFLLCDLRAGVRFDADGVPQALDAAVPRDLDVALSLLRASGLRLVPVLFDFHLCRPRRRLRGVDMGGRSRLLRIPDYRLRLLDTIVTPLAARYGREPLIAAWDLFNEPEWATFGVGTWNPVASVPVPAMRAFLRDATARVRADARQPITVGSASHATLDLIRGIGLDFHQPHWYDSMERAAPLSRPVSTLGGDVPVVLGEFPTSGSARAPGEIVELARQAGYAGAWFWSVLADDRSSAPDVLDRLGDWRPVRV